MVDANEIVSICDGEFEIFRVKPESFEEVIEFYLHNYVKNEPVHKCFNMCNYKSFLDKSAERIGAYLKDEISFAVRHCQSKELAAVRINHMLTNTQPPPPEYKPTSPAVIFVVAFEKRIRQTFNIFKEWDIDCALEMSFLSTSNNFGARGLGTKLSLHTIDFARAMLSGTLKGRECLPPHIRDLKPKAVCSLYSSAYTQKMGEKIGMQVMARIPYTDYFFEDKPLSEIIEPIHTSVVCVAKRL